MAYDHWCTPPEISSRLPTIDTDPCWNPHSAIVARHTYSGLATCLDNCAVRRLAIDAAIDDDSRRRAELAYNPCSHCAGYSDGRNGLVLPWNGLAFVNPPYSAPGAWARKWCQHPTGIWLSEASVGTSWFQMILSASDLVWAFDARLAFCDPRKGGAQVRGARSGHVVAVRGLPPARIPDWTDIAIALRPSGWDDVAIVRLGNDC